MPTFVRLRNLIVLCTLIVLTALFFCNSVVAQESGTETEPPSVVVRQLLEFSGRGDEQMAEAIASLTRIGSWPNVDLLLRKLGAQQLDAPTLARMHAKIGPTVFLKISQEASVSDEAKAALLKLGAAVRQYNESPKRLRQAIAGLGSDSVDERLQSTRALFAGGNVAVAELVAAAVSADPPAPREKILGAIVKFKSGGDDALRQVALYGAPEARAHAISALGTIDRRNFVPDLLTAQYALDSTSEEITVAARHLAAIGKRSTDRNQVIAALALDLDYALNRAAKTDIDDEQRTIWNIGSNSTTVTNQRARAAFAAYREVADASSRLRRIGDLPVAYKAKALAGDITYRVMVDPDWGDRDQIDQVRVAYLFGDVETDTTLLSTAISQTLADDNHPGTIGIIRMLGREEALVDGIGMLRGSDSSLAPLVRAATSSNVRVRYEASLAAAELAGSSAYPGSSRVRHCLNEMARLADEPTVILVETRTNEIVQLEVILDQLGFQAIVVGSVRDLARCIDLGGDLRFILSKTELADFGPVEMLDVVRRIDRGRELPIVFYGTVPARLGEGRWEAPVMLMNRPASPAGLYELLDHQQKRARMPMLTVLDRRRYRSAAQELLK